LRSWRVAMRQGSSTLNYLLSDHLGSTSLATDSSGAEVGELRYYAYGKTRYTSGSTPTSYRFTGQREDATIGLYFYNARFYDATLGRFVQADSIVPEPGNPQALNRYSYCLGNPLRYVDPTGYFTEEEIMGFLGVDTWEDVEAFFKEGLLAGKWGWLEVLIQAEDMDELYAKTGADAEWHRIGRFEAFDNELLIGGAPWLEAASQHDHYRIFRFEQTNWLVPSFLAEPSYFSFETEAYKSGYQRFYPGKLDWPGAILDIAGIASEHPTLGTAGRAINVLDVLYSGFGLIHDAIWEYGAKQHGFEADMLTQEDLLDFGLAVVGCFVPFGPDAWSLKNNVDEAVYGPIGSINR
jgi:RHS repeat-associated protein